MRGGSHGPRVQDHSALELHTDNASLQWLQQQRHLSHQQARWLNLLAEFQYRVVHIPGSGRRRTNPAHFKFLTVTRKRFLDGVGPARLQVLQTKILYLLSQTGTHNMLSSSY
jgi:hypothetical protein